MSHRRRVSADRRIRERCPESPTENAGRRRKDLRDLPSFRFKESAVTAKFSQFFESVVLPRLQLRGYKLAEKRRIAAQIVHKLLAAGLKEAVVSDRRRNGEPGAERRKVIWDAVVAAGLATTCLGSQASGRQTVYQATTELLSLHKEWPLRLLSNLHLNRGSDSVEPPITPALVSLHAGRTNPATGRPLSTNAKKRPISLPDEVRRCAQPAADGTPDRRAVKHGMRWLRALEDDIEQINRSNLEHSWIAYSRDPETDRLHAFQPNPCLRLIYSGKLFRAGRLYSWGDVAAQSLQRTIRRTIRIDGEPTAELDYSGMSTRMLYHLRHLDPAGDVYRPELVLPRVYEIVGDDPALQRIGRDLVKLATNICWNVASRAAAVRALRSQLRKRADGVPLAQLLRSIEQITESDLVGRIADVHPDLADAFFSEVGVELMNVDGCIMRRILRRFADARKPALGIHDAVLCRVSDVEFARTAMEEEYRRSLLFSPKLTVDFAGGTNSPR